MAYLDLDLFSDNLFIFNDSTTSERSAFICILFPKYVKLLNSVVSSAYIIHLNMLLA